MTASELKAIFVDQLKLAIDSVWQHSVANLHPSTPATAVVYTQDDETYQRMLLISGRLSMRGVRLYTQPSLGNLTLTTRPAFRSDTPSGADRLHRHVLSVDGKRSASSRCFGFRQQDRRRPATARSRGLNEQVVPLAPFPSPSRMPSRP